MSIYYFGELVNNTNTTNSGMTHISEVIEQRQKPATPLRPHHESRMVRGGLFPSVKFELKA